MHTILGAGGVIANNLAKELLKGQETLRLVSRKPHALPGTEIIAADLTDGQQAMKAVKGSKVVYLCVGLPYDFSIWRKQWPKIMDNVIDACKESKAKLIFFDNVYMYGKVDGWMTEETPYNPVSRKGDLRARIATQVMSEVRKGNITATIARSADFYGPDAAKTSIPNLLVFENLSKDKKAQWIANANVRHSLTYTVDAAKSLYLLAKNDQSWNQVWHLPTDHHPITGSELISAAANGLGKKDGYTLIRPWMLKLSGLFNRTVSELYEMVYQQQFEYLFDSTKFERAFNYTPVSYQQGIAEIAAHYKNK